MTGCAASAIATHTPNPTGAPGSAPCQPAPVPRANAITTTPPSASSLAAVTTFCTHRPDATPTRLIPVNSATSPTPSGAMSAGGRPESRTRNSPAATPIAAIATPLVPRASTEPRGDESGRAEDPGADGHPDDHGQAVRQPQRAFEIGHTAGECARKSVRAQHAAPLHDNTENSWLLRPAARPSAAVAVASAPTTAAPVSRSRPPAAVTATGRTRSAPPTTATSAPATPPLGSRPRAFISPAAPLGCACRRRRAVGTVTAVTYLPAIPGRECHPLTAATLHGIALAHRRRVRPPP